MKNVLTFVLLLIFTSSFSQNEKTDWLSKNTFPIKTLNDTADFSDLQFLKEVLKNKEIVMLGEGTHSDGSTFEAKNSLVRFLHQEMNFDVLIFEGGFYEGNVIDRVISKAKDPINAAKFGLFMWPYCKQSSSVFTYIAETKKSANPMSIAGMDCKVGTGTSSADVFIYHFKKMLDTLSIDSQAINSSVFNACIKNLWENEMCSKPKGDTIQIFKNDLNKLINILLEKNKGSNSDIAGFWAQNFKSIRNSLDMVWYFKKFKVSKLFFNLNKLYSLRDIQNADNLKWLIENKYKGKKVIVWAATAHLLHNLKSIKVRGAKSLLFNFKNFNNVGDIISKKYPEKTYTIGFTSYAGEKENISGSKNVKFKNGSKNNIEYQLNQLGQNYLFLDFSNKELPKWLNSKLKSGIAGYGNEISVIPNTLDGLFFFKEMKIAEY